MMKIYRNVFFVWACFASFGVFAQGFTTNNTNGNLIDANGNNFIMKGMNVMMAYYINDVNNSIAAVRTNSNSNCLRIVVETFNTDASWQTAVVNCIKNNMIPMVELHDVTGNTDPARLKAMGEFWASKASFFNNTNFNGVNIKRHILINLANEWGTYEQASQKNTAWRDGVINAIKPMRDAGITTTIVVDAVAYGQDIDNAYHIRTYAKDIQRADNTYLGGPANSTSKANILFSLHMYCQWGVGGDNLGTLNTIKTAGIPIIVGEFGYQHPNGNSICDINEQQIINSCQSYGVGWLAWAQKGNGSYVAFLDLCNDWACTSLNAWGNTVINGTNGTKTAQTCSVFTVPEKRYGTNVALNKAVTVSSTEAGLGNVAKNANDGDLGTRWASEYSDPQTIEIDLGRPHLIDTIVLRWEAAYGSAYKIETSASGTSWTQVYSTTTGNGGVDEIAVSNITTRYVRLTGTKRASTFGYSLYEFEIYGEPIFGTNVALNKPVIVSSTEAGSAHVGGNLTDGSKTTRWASASLDNQSAIIDLKTSYSIADIVINWEAAYAQSYSVEVSNDQSTWNTIYTTTTGNGGEDRIENLSATARYVKVNLTKRATTFGFSMYEVAVYGTSVVTNLEDEQDLFSTIYPNPFLDKIHLDFQNEFEVELTDLNGALIYKGHENVLETSSVPSGIYVLKIRQNGTLKVLKMSKN
ncbi:MAG: discoidin domain-containing protein [Cytophagales bacterium]